MCAKTRVRTVVLKNLETQVGQGGRSGGYRVEDPVREGAGSPRHVFFKPMQICSKGRTSDAAQLLMTTEEKSTMAQLSCQPLTLTGHSSVACDESGRGFPGT